MTRIMIKTFLRNQTDAHEQKAVEVERRRSSVILTDDQFRFFQELYCLKHIAWFSRGGGGKGRGVTPLYGLYRYVRPQRVSILTILVSNRV